ncbi:hypothetical protein [Corynebacterium ammoniagenes]|uniref:Uncharacterized protein n=1 Tax=Corynebacterium ammoniagenes DSM 20306 TaxID=649754 RepID=A0ABN0ABM4_CORAM|nr:hypothetical protein [Corynebacterium ammoniagenes]AQS73341.1 hypothetical protein CA40472_05080 [Corynebacterium ammoniagenes]EFG80167.1 hypothetical protein HMPREF0281_02257 [Corynebacterium ammoniagenes DSM 20306]
MALIISIELNNATFEDLATLVSTAGAAGADDSTTIEIDNDAQVLRVIIDNPIAPDIDTTDPTMFTFFGHDGDDIDDIDDYEGFDDFDPSFEDPRGFEDFEEPDYNGGSRRSAPGSFDISGAINDFIENIADELPFGNRRDRNRDRGRDRNRDRGRGFGPRGPGSGFGGYNPNGFPPADYLYGLAEDYFRDFGYRGNTGRDNPPRDNFDDDPLQDDFYTDDPRDDGTRDGRGGERGDGRDGGRGDEREQGKQRPNNPFDNPFMPPFGQSNTPGSNPGNDFGELRHAGESFFKGLSDFINDQVDRRSEGGDGQRKRGTRPGRNSNNGYGSFTDPAQDDEHPEGTSRDDRETEEKLGAFEDFPGFNYLDDIGDLDDSNSTDTPGGNDSSEEDGEYSPGDEDRKDGPNGKDDDSKDNN